MTKKLSLVGLVVSAIITVFTIVTLIGTSTVNAVTVNDFNWKVVSILFQSLILVIAAIATVYFSLTYAEVVSSE